MRHPRGFGPHPLTDYKQVKWWLIANASAVEIAVFVESGKASPVINMALDVFWVSPKRLQADLEKALKHLDGRAFDPDDRGCR